MNPVLQGAFEQGHGLITLAQAVSCGLSRHDVRRFLRHGAWIAVRRGVFTQREDWEALDVWRGRPLQRARAVHLTMVEDHVMSHHSAAYALGLDTLHPGDDEPVHITRPDVRGSRTRFGVKHHGAVFRDEQIVLAAGLPVLGPARTAIDIAREHGLHHGVVACDSAMQMRVTRGELMRAYVPMWSWPNVRAVRQAVELADEGAESVGESLSRLLVLELGIGVPQTQFTLRDGARWAACDLRVGRHLFEFDGRMKYQRRQEGGYADDADPGSVVWREKKRQDWLCSYDLGMSRIIWSELFGVERERTKARLRREYAATVARFGTSIDDLAPYIHRRAS